MRALNALYAKYDRLREPKRFLVAVALFSFGIIPALFGNPLLKGAGWLYLICLLITRVRYVHGRDFGA